MTTSSFLLAAVLGATASPAGSSSATMYAYLKPSVAPVPAECKGSKAVAGLVQVPLFGDDSAACPVARVGDQSITLIDLSEILAASHESRETDGTAASQKGVEQQVGPALDRLIQVRLVTEEAREMGMGDVPEAKQAMALFEEQVVRLALETQATEGVRADPAEVERLYRDAIREWKVRTVLFKKQADAKAFASGVKGGGDFEALARKAVADAKAKDGGPSEWVFSRNVQAAIAHALAKAKPGFLSGPIQLPDGGFAVVRVDDVRFVDDPKAKASAQEASLLRQQRIALEKLLADLASRYAKIDDKLLAKLDWEAKKPGYQALARDTRAVATIAGEKPITVADLSAELTATFFHGMESPIKEKRVNKGKNEAFQKLLMKRLFEKEARARNLQDQPAVKRAVQDYRNAVLFAVFVERVIVPGVKVSEAEAQAHYEKNKARYSYPQMYKLDGIAFQNAKAAQSAVERLRGGTDFQWMRANAEGQVKLEERTLPLDNAAVVIASSLPAGLAKALAGSGTGDYRIYAASEKEFYVVRVVENIPPKAQPYLEVREPVARAVQEEKTKQAVKEYADKLRAAGDVEVYLARIGT
jgi:hypothetical protein